MMESNKEWGIFMTHMHLTAWVLAVILLIVATVQLKKGNQKVYKIAHMILRIDYLLIIASGIVMITTTKLTGDYAGKTILGIIVIGLTEMLLVKMNKGKPVKGISIALAAFFVVIVAFGFYLPQGFDFLRI